MENKFLYSFETDDEDSEGFAQCKACDSVFHFDCILEENMVQHSEHENVIVVCCPVCGAKQE